MEINCTLMYERDLWPPQASQRSRLYTISNNICNVLGYTFYGYN